MKVPISWLKEYVDIAVPLDELARRLTMAGTEVAEVVSIGGWQSCFVGLVTKVERHPNADRLTLCTVDIGAEQMQVVCGAPNVAEQQKIAFAKVGATLFSTHSGKVEPLKAARIRGVVSEGMICSEVELRLGDDHDGILVLREDAPIGTDLSDYLGDHILDVTVTPNRPDCLSILGIAREVAALTCVQVKEPDSSYPEDGQPIGSLASVEIEDPELCPRYTASVITEVKIGPSPGWLQDRLTKAGMRSINNVVDVTNYVMLEYNQPLHAFDFKNLKESRIRVRRARQGEVLNSLDGAKRVLSTSMLVIADAEDPVALGGVIGGAHSEVTEKTTEILLESANFNAINNRRTAQASKISTDASTRFEKGLRAELPPIALRRATRLIRDVAGGVVAKDILDEFPGREQIPEPILTLTTKRLQRVLGTTLPAKRVEEALVSLGFGVEQSGETDLTVAVPYWRSDIHIQDDLIEEVARIIGYDEIPTTTLSTPIPPYQPQPKRELKERIRDLLVGYGLQEIVSYPASSLEDLDKVRGLNDSIHPVRLANPMSVQHEYMRTTLRAGLLSTLAANVSHAQGPIALFEIGRVFLPRDGDLPDEPEIVAAVFCGPRSETHWLSSDGDLGFYDPKGIVEAMMEKLGIDVGFEAVDDPILHPGKGARVMAGDKYLGVTGEVHPAVVKSFDLPRSPVAMFELDIGNLLSVVPGQGPRYKPVGRFPSAIRDLSIIVDMGVPASAVQALIRSRPLVGNVRLFDTYTGGNIPEGKRSLAYHIYFQSHERTLTTEEITSGLKAVVDCLEREVGALVRGVDVAA